MDNTGAIGIYSVLLAISLYALGRRTFAALLLGLLPGIHASLAIAAWAIVASAILFQGRLRWNYLRPMIFPFAIGSSLSIIGLLIQFAVPEDPAWMACSLRVLLNLSATPFVSGSSTKPKLGRMPQ